MSATPNYTKAIELFNQGDFLSAFKIFQQLKLIFEAGQNSQLEELLGHYHQCLAYLFDKNLRECEEALKYDKEVNTALLLVSLCNLYPYYKSVYRFDEKQNRIRFKGLSRLIQKWVLKVFANTKTDLQKRHLEKYINEIQALFDFASNLFQKYFYPILNDIERGFDISAFQKPVDLIYFDIGLYFLSQIADALSHRNIITTGHYYRKFQQILKLVSNPEKLKKKAEGIKRDIVELQADFEIEAGRYFENDGDLDKAQKYYKIAYTNYRSAFNEKKSFSTKDLYLQTSVKLGNQLLEKGKENVEVDQSSALFFLQKACSIFRDINAKSELEKATEETRKLFYLIGNNQVKLADSLPSTNLGEISIKLNHYNDALRNYYEAKAEKAYRAVKTQIIRLQKDKLKFLLNDEKKAHKLSDIELEFLVLEDIHQVYYELEENSQTKVYARKIEKLKDKVNFDTLSKLKEARLAKNPWLSQEHHEEINAIQYDQPPNVPSEEADEEMLKTSPFHISSMNEETSFTSFNSGNNTKTFISKFGEKQPIINANPLERVKGFELKTLYPILKKFNNREFLTNEEIRYLKDFGLNLPEDNLYYHRYPKSKYQFFTFTDHSNTPQVIMIPTKSLIVRNDHLGIYSNLIDPYLPHNQDILQYPAILANHIEFCLNVPNWKLFMESADFTTFQRYLNFLNALRLLQRKEGYELIAKNLNSSLVEEFLSLSTENVEKYLKALNGVDSFLEFLNWSTNTHLRILLFGLSYFVKGNIEMASIYWSMLFIS